MALGPDAPQSPSRAQTLLAHVMFSARTAAEAVGNNKLRAGLTSLGILFGVASVIAMLAIGNGAEQEILAQMKMLGANNIVITPIIEQKEGDFEPDKFKDRYEAALRDLIRRKQKGEKLVTAEPVEESNVIDLMEALKKSLKNKGKAAPKPANTNAKKRKAR